MCISILHLSDLHLGHGEFRDEDIKSPGTGARSRRPIDILASYLEALKHCPDFVVISGDICQKSDVRGLEEFKNWLDLQFETGLLPGPKCTIITPGNHDVKLASIAGEQNRERYTPFWSCYAKAYPHAYIPDLDPVTDSQAKLKKRFEDNSLVGGISTKSNRGELQLVESLPFIFDKDKDLLIYAFNSTLASQVLLTPNVKIAQNLTDLKAQCADNPTALRTIESIDKAYFESLRIDAGLIGTRQLEVFAKTIQAMRKALGSDFTKVTKIAVLHHHIGCLWDQQLEVKTFESVIDASTFKRILIESEFDFVLHGHKHLNHVGLDGTLIPLSNNKLSSNYGPLCTIAGGTVGGDPRPGQKQTFKIIQFDERSGPRKAAKVIETPVSDTSNPQRIMSTESTIYSVPISSHLPSVWDDRELKTRIDQAVFDMSCPEIKADHNLEVSRDVSLPPYDQGIVSSERKYKAYAKIASGTRSTYVEVILLAERIGFGTEQRVVRLISDVKRANTNAAIQPSIILLLGNLEYTHLFRGASRGEVSESITTFRAYFKPATDGALLEIRDHTFSQKEIQAFIRTMNE